MATEQMVRFSIEITIGNPDSAYDITAYTADGRAFTAPSDLSADKLVIFFRQLAEKIADAMTPAAARPAVMIETDGGHFFPDGLSGFWGGVPFGGSGNDTLVGSGGTSITMHGGAGNDMMGAGAL